MDTNSDEHKRRLERAFGVDVHIRGDLDWPLRRINYNVRLTLGTIVVIQFQNLDDEEERWRSVLSGQPHEWDEFDGMLADVYAHVEGRYRQHIENLKTELQRFEEPRETTDDGSEGKVHGRDDGDRRVSETS